MREAAEPAEGRRLRARRGTRRLLRVLTLLVVAVVGIMGPSGSALARFSNGRILTTTCTGAWEVVPSPDGPGNKVVALTSVSFADATRGWAVGYSRTGWPHFASSTLIERWSGTAWRIVPSPNPGTYGDDFLKSVWAAARSDVWAVGAQRVGSTWATLIEHWDGSAWTVAPSPNLGTASNYLVSVSGRSPGDVWAVGSYRDTSLHMLEPLTEHWDGNSWSVLSAPGSPDGAQLLGVAAGSSETVTAVGRSPTRGSRTFAEAWDGCGSSCRRRTCITTTSSRASPSTRRGARGRSGLRSWGRTSRR